MNKSLLATLLFFSVISYAQKKRSPSVSQSTITLSNARLEACMVKNKRLTQDMISMNNTIGSLNAELSNATGSASVAMTSLQRTRDSLDVTLKSLLKLEEESKLQLTVMSDSLAALREFRELATQRMNKIIDDPNVVRVFDFPSDLVRIKLLRKFLEDGSGIVLEKNTDDGFAISRVYKDRIKKKALSKKVIETKVESELKLDIHPYNEDRTLFYQKVKVFEKIGKSEFVEVSDPAVIKDYFQKSIKFYDNLLAK